MHWTPKTPIEGAAYPAEGCRGGTMGAKMCAMTGRGA